MGALIWRGVVVVCACSALTLVEAGSALAAPTWLSPVDLSAAGQDASGPHVAVDQAGDAAAVWHRYDGTNWIVQAAARPAGGSFGTPVDLSAAGGNAYDPQVAVDRAGDAVAVWDRFNGSNYVVQAATRPAGGSFGSPVDLSAVGESASIPQVALDQAGDAVAVWERYDGTNWIVQAAARPAGGSFGSPVDLSAAGGNAYDPEVAVDQAGDAAAVWDRFNGSNYVVQAATRPAGGSFGTPVNLSAAGEDASMPQVAVDQASDAVAVWRRYDGSHYLVQAAARQAGGSFGTPVNLSAAGQNAFGPQVALDQAGDAVAVWERSNGTNDIVQAATRPPGGSFGTPVDLSAIGENADDPQVALDQAGDATAVWHRSNGTNDIVQAATRPPGGSFGAAVDLSVTGENAYGPQVAVDPAGDAAVVWERSNGTNDIVQAAGYDFAGPQLRGVSIPATGTAGTPVSFAVSPLDVWSGVASTSWSFGDGQAASGAAVSHTYATAGTYRVSVTATDGDGNTSTASGQITITAAPFPPPASKAPALSGLSVTPRKLSFAGRLVGGDCVKPTKHNHARRHCRRTIKLKIRYTLNTADTVTFTLKREAPGRKVGGHCVNPTHKNRKHKMCARLIGLRGQISKTGATGANSFVWGGKLGGHTLGPGTYELIATPARGTPTTQAFKIVG